MRKARLSSALCAVSLLASSLVALAAGPAIDFYAPRDYALPSPSSVVIGDFNADTKPDVAVANYYHRSITISINGGGVSSITVPQFATALALGHFNGDSRLDLVVANRGPATVSVLLGNGDGTFQAPQSVSAPPGPRSLAVADLNGDQKDDVAVGTENALWVLLGNGNGTLQAPIGVHPQEALRDFAIGDFNNDAKLDIVAGASARVALLLGNGNGTFQAPVFTSVLFSLNALAAADFNGDGNLDAAFAHLNSIWVLSGNGNGTFGVPGPVAQTGASFLTVADFNRDSKPDLVAARSITSDSAPNVFVLTGAGNGSFLPLVGVVTAHGTEFYGNPVATGDLNGDLNPDIVVARTSAINGSVGGALSVRFGKGDGTFHATPGLPTGVIAGDMISADFNGDGKMDLAGAFYTPFAESRWLAAVLGNGDGTFQAASFVLQTQGGFGGEIAAGDFNSDSKLDLVAVVGSNGATAVLLGQGDGNFQVGPTFVAGGSVVVIAVSDFNHDAKPDLAMIAGGPAHVSLLIGNGDGTFQAPVTVPAGPDPAALDIADFNGDSHMDLAVANVFSNTVSMLLGNGNGTFQPAIGTAVGEQPDTIAIGDFNGDTRLDLAVALNTTPAIQVLLGNGNGTFQPPVRYVIPGFTNDSILVADFDGDLRQDLAVPVANTVWVLRGAGDGTFSLQLTGFSSAHNPVQLMAASADFTSDGKPDIAAQGDGGLGVGIAILVNFSRP